MGYIIKGWNDFYEGWLARCLEQPDDESQNESWQEGWKMGDETGELGRMLALCEEIRIGQAGTALPEAHVVVEKCE